MRKGIGMEKTGYALHVQGGGNTDRRVERMEWKLDIHLPAMRLDMEKVKMNRK